MPISPEAKKLVLALNAYADTDGDRKVGAIEQGQVIKRALNGVPHETMAAFTKATRALVDRDHDGSVSIQEYVAAPSRIAGKMMETIEKIANNPTILASLKDGELTHSEFDKCAKVFMEAFSGTSPNAPSTPKAPRSAASQKLA